ncbi:MAG: aspartate aminotransferase family protein [Proteobacteria bacterium]|nr:aspartate aminotransferase family protein [Pseudomonadota bacterium]
MYSIFDDAVRRARAYLDNLGQKPRARPAAAARDLRDLDDGVPAEASDPAVTLELLARLGTPGVSHIGVVALRWLVDLLELPTGTGAVFVHGATAANFTALAAARNSVLARVGWNVEENGVSGAPAITIITGHEAHPSLTTSLRMLGLGSARIVKVSSDDQGRMRPSGLPLISGPTILCVQAGNLNSGSFDDFGAIIPRTRALGAWIHVEGTFGLWAKASPLLRPLARGLEQADSWATDAREWLDVPYDSGLTFVRDPNTLQAATAVTGSESPVRGVELWAALRSLGRSGLAELFERNCRQARRFARDLRSAGHEILNEVVLNRVVVAVGDAARTRRLAAALQKEGIDWCEYTEWRGRIALKITVRSWALSDDDVERSVQAILRAAAAT